MKKLCSILLITALCVSLVACGSKNKEKRQVNSIVTTMGNNASFPSAVNVFSTTDLEGNTVTNDILSQADLTVVNFWGTFCNPCINEMPELAKWNEEMPDNVQMLGAIVDVETVDSDEYALAQQIVENCETLPMLGDWRLVIVQGLALLESGKAKDEAQESKTLVDYIGRVPPSTCLVFECEAPDKRKKLCQTLMKLPGAVSFDALSDARLTQWMNQTLRPMKKRMDANTCAHLAFTSGRDLTMLNGELQKLAAYVGERETITAEDVEQIATHTAECTVFAMVDALVDGQAERAFSLLNVLLEGGEQRIGVLALITRQYRQMLYAKDMQESRTPQVQMAKALGVPPFALSQLTRRAGRRTMAQLKKQLALCVNADFDIKRGAVREEAALDRLMLALTEK